MNRQNNMLQYDLLTNAPRGYITDWCFRKTLPMLSNHSRIYEYDIKDREQQFQNLTMTLEVGNANIDGFFNISYLVKISIYSPTTSYDCGYALTNQISTSHIIGYFPFRVHLPPKELFKNIITDPCNIPDSLIMDLYEKIRGYVGNNPLNKIDKSLFAPLRIEPLNVMKQEFHLTRLNALIDA